MRTLGAVASQPTDVILFDHFNGALDTNIKWNVYSRLPDMYNNELNCCTTQNVTTAGSMLRITAVHEDSFCGDTWPSYPPNPRTMNYTSGHIAMRQSAFLYGTIDVRAKIASGIGLWPCLWMLDYDLQERQPRSAMEWGGVFYAEIDFAEFMGNSRTTVNCQIHWMAAGQSQVDPGGIVSLPAGFNASNAFAVYRLNWRAGSAIFSVDYEDGSGFRTIQTITSAPGVLVPNIPMYVTINMPTGGNATTAPDNATLPSTMEIDYIRITR